LEKEVVAQVVEGEGEAEVEKKEASAASPVQAEKPKEEPVNA